MSGTPIGTKPGHLSNQSTIRSPQSAIEGDGADDGIRSYLEMMFYCFEMTNFNPVTFKVMWLPLISMQR